MSLSADVLLDRMHLKGQLTKWRIIAIVCMLLAGFAIFENSSGAKSAIEKEYIARISFDKIIMDDRDEYELIDDVADNPKVKAVILWIDSPGGSAVGGEELFLRIRALAAKKPVVAVMRSIAASAGYMLSLSSDHIIAREGTITGSIGVIIEAAEVTELAKKIGVEPIIVKSAPLKSTLSPFEKATPESRAVIQELIDDFYNRFVNMVAERRKLPRDQVVKLADGRVYSGARALELKLIDELGGEAEAVTWLETQRKVKKGLEIKDEKVEEPTDWMHSVGKSIFGKFLQNSSIGLDGLAAIWHPSDM
jgi:protease-4